MNGENKMLNATDAQKLRMKQLDEIENKIMLDWEPTSKKIKELNKQQDILREKEEKYPGKVMYRPPNYRGDIFYSHIDVTLLCSDFHNLQATLATVKKDFENNTCTGFFGNVPEHIKNVKNYLNTHQTQIDEILEATQLSAQEKLSCAVYRGDKDLSDIHAFIKLNPNPNLAKATVKHLLEILSLLKIDGGLPIAIGITQRENTKTVSYQKPQAIDKPFFRNDDTQNFYLKIVNTIGEALANLWYCGLINEVGNSLYSMGNTGSLKQGFRST